MGMTMTQKILAAHAGLDHVEAGQLIEAQLDLVLGNDITSPVAIHEMDKMTVDTVFDKDKIALVMDHFIPNKDIKSAEHCKCVREFACRHDITNYFDVGQMGIEHALLPEKGLTVAGDVIIGADSHTCTYGALGAFSTGVGSTDMAAGMATGKAWFKVPSAIKFNIVGKPKKWVSGKDVILHIIGMIGVDGALYKSMEFVGEGIKNLSMDDRFTIANMAIEAGGKNGIFPVDDLAIEYMKEHSKRPYTAYEADEDAVYEAEYTIDLSTLEPTVAFPHLPENTKTISEIGEPVVVDQSVIGSCTNGRIDDLRVAAQILKGRKVKKGLRCIVIPATQAIYLQAMEEGLLKIFIEAGAVVSTPTCGPCLGGYMGILAAGERCISTTNRNFVGRMGHVESEVYLAEHNVQVHVGQGRVVERLEGAEVRGADLRRAVAAPQMAPEGDGHLLHHGLAGLGTGRGDLQRRDEVLGAVLADLADGQLASREHHRFGQTRQHERERRGGVGHGIGAVQHDEAVEVLVTVGDHGRYPSPAGRVHVRGVDGRVHLHVIEIEAEAPDLRHVPHHRRHLWKPFCR